MDAASSRDQIRDAGFAVLADLVQPALMLERAADGAGVGRLGGQPRLTEGTVWPRRSSPESEPWPLTFIAEFELPALDPAVGPGPRGGSLSVFCDVDEETLWVHRGGSALVIHHPADVARATVD